MGQMYRDNKQTWKFPNSGHPRFGGEKENAFEISNGFDQQRLAFTFRAEFMGDTHKFLGESIKKENTQILVIPFFHMEPQGVDGTATSWCNPQPSAT